MRSVTIYPFLHVSQQCEKFSDVIIHTVIMNFTMSLSFCDLISNIFSWQNLSKYKPRLQEKLSHNGRNPS